MITRIAWPAALALLLAIALMMCVSGCGRSSTELLPPNKALNSQMSAELAATLAELESLPCPEGAAAGTFASVKSRLREYLLENTSVKETRKAPDDDRPLGWNCGFDFYWEDDGTARGRLTWTYRNRGDYNQDGIVSIADVTPVAIHFDCEAGPDCPYYPDDDMTEVHEIVDGDGNGTIGYSDVDVIGIHFKSLLSYYSLRAYDEPGDSFDQSQEVARIPFKDYGTDFGEDPGDD